MAIDDPSGRKAVSILHACQLAGVCRRTLYNWMEAGKVEYVRTAGGRRRVFVDTLFRTPVQAQPLPPFPYGPLIPPQERARMAKLGLS